MSDGEDVFIPTLLTHFELAGIHSGDSACITPPQNLSLAIEMAIRNQATQVIKSLNIVGIVNMQFTDASKGAVSWQWNFGDGSTSYDENPSCST